MENKQYEIPSALLFLPIKLTHSNNAFYSPALSAANHGTASTCSTCLPLQSLSPFPAPPPHHHNHFFLLLSPPHLLFLRLLPPFFIKKINRSNAWSDAVSQNAGDARNDVCPFVYCIPPFCRIALRQLHSKLTYSLITVGDVRGQQLVEAADTSRG